MENLFETKMNELFNIMTRNMGTSEILITLCLAGFMSLIVYFAYRFAHTKQSYQPKFAVTLVIIAFVSTILMDLVQSNLALSLGMLGSLSIVRFRTNIKDPRDIGFVVWSMAVGIAAATQSYMVGIVGSLLLAIVMIVTKSSETAVRQMLLIVRGSDTDLDHIQSIVGHMEGSRIKAKNVMSDSFELVYEVNVRDSESNKVIEKIFELGGIDSVNLLSQNNAV